MTRSAMLAVALLTISMTAPPASADTVAAIVQSDGTVSCVQLEGNAIYVLHVSGAYFFGVNEGRMADAGYSSNQPGFQAPLVEFTEGGAYGFLIDGEHPDVGPYRDVHTYTVELGFVALQLGTHCEIELSIGDSYYPDNVGTLKVVVTEVT